MNIDYYPVRGEHLEVGDAFIHEEGLWIRVGDEDADRNFPAFCLDPDVSTGRIVMFAACGGPVTRVDLDIVVNPATPRNA
jgi:hypothetical protein